jgi:hypothetical protein
MNERIKELITQATTEEHDGFLYFDKKKFAELIVRECEQAVLAVPCHYNDYRDQIEAAVIRDCARAVLEHFGVEL